jgi:hypothetical protein
MMYLLWRWKQRFYWPRNKWLNNYRYSEISERLLHLAAIFSFCICTVHAPHYPDFCRLSSVSVLLYLSRAFCS